MNDITRSLRTNRRLASRRLDQLVAAAAPGLALLSPRSALATAEVLGQRSPRPAAAPGSAPGGSRIGRADRSRA